MSKLRKAKHDQTIHFILNILQVGPNQTTALVETLT